MLFFKRLAIPLLLLTGLVFLFLLITLAYFNRPASDDYQFISQLNQSGIWGSLKFYYNNWSVRWSSLLYFNFIFSLARDFSAHPFYIFLYYLFSLLLLSLSAYMLLRSILNLFFEELPSPFLIFSTSTLFQASIFFMTPHTVEIWFWILASFIYLQPCIFLLTGLILIFLPRRKTLFSFLALPFFIYIGGAHEGFAMLVLAALFTLFAISYRWENTFAVRRGLGMASTVLLLSLSINICNPGAEIRKEKEQSRSTTEKTDFNRRVFEKLSESLLQKKNLIFTAVPWLLLGYYMRDKKRKATFFSGMRRSRVFAGSAILLVLLGTVSMIPVVYVFRSLGPERCLFPVIILLNIFLAHIFFSAGRQLPGSISAYIPAVASFTLALNLVFFSRFAYENCHSAEAYARSYDQRIDHLFSLEGDGNKEKVILTQLPDPGPFLLNGDIMVESVCFPTAVGVSFDIGLRR